MSENHNLGRSTPMRDIYARRVPGISDGGLWRAMQQGDRPHDQPTLNDAFTRTSPTIYQHYQQAMAPAAQPAYGYQPVAYNALQQQQQQQQTFVPSMSLNQPTMPSDLAPQFAESASSNVGDVEPAVDTLQSERFDAEMLAMRRRVADLSASVREYHAKEISRHGEVLEQLQSMQCAWNTRTWILIAFGVVLIALLLLLICLTVKWTAANQTAIKASSRGTSGAALGTLPPTAARNVAARQAALQEPSEDFI